MVLSFSQTNLIKSNEYFSVLAIESSYHSPSIVGRSPPQLVRRTVRTPSTTTRSSSSDRRSKPWSRYHPFQRHSQQRGNKHTRRRDMLYNVQTTTRLEPCGRHVRNTRHQHTKLRNEILRQTDGGSQSKIDDRCGIRE